MAQRRLEAAIPGGLVLEKQEGPELGKVTKRRGPSPERFRRYTDCHGAGNKRGVPDGVLAFQPGDWLWERRPTRLWSSRKRTGALHKLKCTQVGGPMRDRP